jgi:hypothetical protein
MAARPSGILRLAWNNVDLDAGSLSRLTLLSFERPATCGWYFS